MMQKGNPFLLHLPCRPFRNPCQQEQGHGHDTGRRSQGKQYLRRKCREDRHPDSRCRAHGNRVAQTEIPDAFPAVLRRYDLDGQGRRERRRQPKAKSMEDTGRQKSAECREQPVSRRGDEGRQKSQEETAFLPQSAYEGVRKQPHNDGRQGEDTGNDADFTAAGPDGSGVHGNGRDEHMKIDKQQAVPYCNKNKIPVPNAILLIHYIHLIA